MTQLRDWQKRFYPVTALKLVEEFKDPIQLTVHALRKWIGFKPQHLEYYGLNLSDATEFVSVHVQEPGNDVEFTIDGYTCSLCQVYSIPMSTAERCLQCPLYETQRFATCGGMLSTSPYGQFLRDKDPEPMIKALRETLFRLTQGRLQVDDEGNSWLRDQGPSDFDKVVDSIKGQHQDMAHKLANLHEKMAKEAQMKAENEDFKNFVANVEALEKVELQNIIFNIAYAMYDVSEDNSEARYDFDREVNGADIVDTINVQFTKLWPDGTVMEDGEYDLETNGRWCNYHRQFHGVLYICDHYPQEVRDRIAAETETHKARLQDPHWCAAQLALGLPYEVLMLWRAFVGLTDDIELPVSWYLKP